MPHYEVKPLASEHDRTAFSCGVEPLDRYFRDQAGQEMRRNVAAVFVLRVLDSSAVAGYYTLSAMSLEPTELPLDLIKRLPRYPTLPALLIGRLAVDRRYQGQGIGRALLMSALSRSLNLRSEVGAIGVVVDAKDDVARQFYAYYGFQPFLNRPYRLFLPMKTIERLRP